MKLKDILKVKGSKVWMIREDQTVQEALQVLVSQKIGALLVLDENDRNITGIISERDLVRGLYSHRKSFDAARVRDLMTRKVITADPEDEIKEIMQVMTDKRIRHVPIVSGGELQGIVSIGDVVKALLEESEHQIQHLKDYLYGS